MSLAWGTVVAVDSRSVVVNHNADFVFALLDHDAGFLRLCMVLGVVERLLDYAQNMVAILDGKALQVNFWFGVKTARDSAVLRKIGAQIRDGVFKRKLL